MTTPVTQLLFFAQEIAGDHLVPDVYWAIAGHLARLSDESLAARLLAGIHEKFSFLPPQHLLFQPVPSKSLIRVEPFTAEYVRAIAIFAGSSERMFTTYPKVFEIQDAGLDPTTLPRDMRLL